MVGADTKVGNELTRECCQSKSSERREASGCTGNPQELNSPKWRTTPRHYGQDTATAKTETIQDRMGKNQLALELKMATRR